MSSRQHFCAAFFNKCFHGFGGIKISVFLSFFPKNKCFHSSFWKKNTDRRTFPEMLSNRRDMLSIRQHFRKCCRIDEKWCRVEKCCRICEMLSSRRKFWKCCRIDEKCCRVDDILFPLGKNGKVVESTRNVGESTKFPEMLSNRREMLSSRRHFQLSLEN